MSSTKTATKTGGKAKAKKTVTKTGGKRKAGPQLMVKVSVSGPLADVIGSTPRPRGQIVKAVWDYIKKHKLQTQVGGKGGFIKPDEKLGKVFGSSKVIPQTKMMGHIFKYVGKK